MTQTNSNSSSSTRRPSAARKSSSAIRSGAITPKAIKEYLDRYVIGQDEAKKTLATAVYQHLKRVGSKDEHGESLFAKSNVLLLGETGSGKTLLVKTIARMLDVPCYIQDCTKITASGYVGSDVEDCLAGLLRECDYDLEMAQKGIVMLDEIDKNASAEAGASIVRDVSGTCVQQSLLKIVEGDKVGVPPAGGRKHPEQPLIYVDTSDILFIASGAFVGLEDIIRKRIGTDASKIGFTSGSKKEADSGSVLSEVTSQDLRQFGMIPEFVGRFPVVTHVEPLDESTITRILTEPADSLVQQYTNMLALDGFSLEFEDDALGEIARHAMSMGTGARGLRSIMETVMRDILFEAPSSTSRKRNIVITAKYVQERLGKAVYVKKAD